MPSHNEMTDVTFMGCPIPAQAAYTGDTKYFDMIAPPALRKARPPPDGIMRHCPR
jgi:hypothetical protein